MKLAPDMTLDELAARMRELEARCDDPGSLEDSLNMLAEYLELENEWGQRTGYKPGMPIH